MTTTLILNRKTRLIAAVATAVSVYVVLGHTNLKVTK